MICLICLMICAICPTCVTFSTGGQARIRAAHIASPERGGPERGIGFVPEGAGGGGVNPAADVSAPGLPRHQAQRERWTYIQVDTTEPLFDQVPLRLTVKSVGKMWR